MIFALDPSLFWTQTDTRPRSSRLNDSPHCRRTPAITPSSAVTTLHDFIAAITPRTETRAHIGALLLTRTMEEQRNAMMTNRVMN
jgi:hypothetical protein